MMLSRRISWRIGFRFFSCRYCKARAKANGLAEETRQGINAEIAKAKTEGEAQAAAAMAAADARIEATRTQAKTHIADSARDAAIAIVARLTGETVTADEATKAVGG